MRKIATQVQLDQDQYNAVQELAKDKGWSMAEIIRRALAEYLKKEVGK